MGKSTAESSGTFGAVVVLFCSAMRETDGRVNERRARVSPVARYKRACISTSAAAAFREHRSRLAFSFSLFLAATTPASKSTPPIRKHPCENRSRHVWSGRCSILFRTDSPVVVDRRNYSFKFRERCSKRPPLYLEPILEATVA